MIGMWLFGDMYRVSYYEHSKSPAQLIICAFFSCLVDCAILSQFYVYRRLTAYENAKSQSTLDSDTLISSATITANFTNIEEQSRESSEKMIEFSVSNGSDFQPKTSPN